MPGFVGEASFKKLQEYLDFSQKNKVSNIIVHLGFFNSFTEDRYAILERTAKLFSRLETGNVRICIENIPCWTNISFENEPIISGAEHFIHFQKTFPWAGATFDVDHHAINTVFQQFYALFKQRYKEFPDKDKFKSLMEEEMVQCHQQGSFTLQKTCRKRGGFLPIKDNTYNYPRRRFGLLQLSAERVVFLWSEKNCL